jgi:hypothetical protein
MAVYHVVRTRIGSFVNPILGRPTDRKRGAVRACSAITLGTGLAFLASLLRPPLRAAEQTFQSFLKSARAPHAFAEAAVILASLTLIGVILGLPSRWWRSLRVGLVAFPYWGWVLSVVAFWMSLDAHYPRAAVVILASAAVLAAVINSIGRYPLKTQQSASPAIDPDLPVPENGEDLLGRRAITEDLISMIVFQRPMVIAVTGAYGEGKTSLLNLTIGELRKIDEDDLPIIVRFSPWLAGDSDTLVLSLLNSIVAEIKARYQVPGLSRDAARYARILLSVVPRGERMKDLVTEPSQEERIAALADRISRTRRRVLVVLDDLDRMEARELETVFKLLRGSARFSNFTFLCAFGVTEIAEILRSTRPSQDTAKFVEKFFQLQVPLPKVDPAQLRDFFSERISAVLNRYGVAEQYEPKSLEEFWENGAGSYFQNLRRIKLFLNRIDRSLERIADEVNVGDFIKLELVRDIAPGVYEEIYQNPQYFYNEGFVFEPGYRRLGMLDEDGAAEQRAAFYDSVLNSLPPEKRYVSQLLVDLFPNFAQYRRKSISGGTYEGDAESQRRIFHPRCFRQYFLLRVPSELFSQKELKSFTSSIRHLREDKAADAFGKAFRALAKEDFKRWHFMYRLESVTNELRLESARGLCRGMAQNASVWRWDALELMIAVNCTRETLRRIADAAERQELLRSIIQESTSNLYTVDLIWLLEKDASPELLSDLEEVKSHATKHLKAQYFAADAPSVFEQFGGANPIQDIGPVQFLFGWKHLGTDAEADQRHYLEGLFGRRPEDLNELLKQMFRVRFIDDYTALKPLIDYRVLADLITRNESILDSEKVRNFRERYNAEMPAAG